MSEEEYRALLRRNPGYATAVKPAPTQNPHRKYRNTPTTVDGIKFASKKEAKRYAELKLMEKAGEIGVVLRQVRWPLTVNGIKVGTYVADFDYNTAREYIIEDCKGYRTPVYKLKKLLMFAIHGIKIKET